VCRLHRKLSETGTVASASGALDHWEHGRSLRGDAIGMVHRFDGHRLVDSVEVGGPPSITQISGKFRDGR